MKTFSKALVLSCVLIAAFFAAGCPERRSIADIEANPSKYAGKTVGVAGRVTDSYGIPLVGGVYKIDDGTGSLWILTERGVPQKGARVGVKGSVESGITFGGRNYGLGMLEEDRRLAK